MTNQVVAFVSDDRGGGEEERDCVCEPVCDDGVVELVFEQTSFGRVECAALSGCGSPAAEAENVVDGGRVPHQQRSGFDGDVDQAVCGEKAGMLMRQGAVAEEDVSPEPQHAPGQALVGDVENLSVVVRVCEDDAATRPDKSRLPR
ncbi:hypothetical protein AB0J20_01760 [Micromonospora costi]|uniref:hypothetical protein n=1 Tax=Micromonospora costi TaxID=1530042 RepID=UPI0033D1E17E